DLGFHHGPPHGGSWLCNGIAAQIDHFVRNSWKTSLESRTPREVSRRTPPAVSTRPASRNLPIGSENRCHSAGSGRIPSINRRPTKKRSSWRRASVAAAVAHARYASTDSGFWRRIRPSKEWASAPKPTYRSSFQYLRLCRDSKPCRAKFE